MEAAVLDVEVQNQPEPARFRDAAYKLVTNHGYLRGAGHPANMRKYSNFEELDRGFMVRQHGRKSTGDIVTISYNTPTANFTVHYQESSQGEDPTMRYLRADFVGNKTLPLGSYDFDDEVDGDVWEKLKRKHPGIVEALIDKMNEAAYLMDEQREIADGRSKATPESPNLAYVRCEIDRCMGYRPVERNDSVQISI